MNPYNYPNLHEAWNWRIGAHRAPAHYEHPWLAVLDDEVFGAWTREEARQIVRRWREWQRITRQITGRMTDG